jgi:hypothetical protein
VILAKGRYQLGGRRETKKRMSLCNGVNKVAEQITEPGAEDKTNRPPNPGLTVMKIIQKKNGTTKTQHNEKH